jgi:hypothetical protein
MADDFASRTLAALRERYGDRWQLWYVRCYSSPDVWCGAPTGSDVSTIRAGSPEELVRAINEAEARSGKSQVTAD